MASKLCKHHLNSELVVHCFHSILRQLPGSNFQSIMPKTKELSEAAKISISILIAEGYHERQVAKRLNVSKSAVHYTEKRQEEHGNTKLQAVEAENGFLFLWTAAVSSVQA